MILAPSPSTRASPARAEPLPDQSIMPPLRGPVDSPATLRGFGSYRVKAPNRLIPAEPPEDMPCVICHQPAILRSPRGKPCHWTCALAWVTEHHDQAEAHDQHAA